MRGRQPRDLASHRNPKLGTTTQDYGSKMAMKPRLWNTHALAVEFGLGYRVAAARLADVPPAKMQGRQALYRIQDAAPALLGQELPGRSPPAPEKTTSPRGLAPDGGRFTHASLAAEALALVMIMMAERAPAAIASALVGAGMPVRAARDAFGTVAVSLMMMVDSIAAEEKIAWRSEEHFPLPPPPDWRELAHEA
jgi:hypothetical protein